MSTEQKANTTPTEPANIVTVNTFDLQKAIVEAVKEYGKTLAEDVKKEVLEDVMKTVENIKKEAANAVRKGLGIEQDPVVHLSDIQKEIRKALLEAAPPNKKTLTETPEKPAEGEVTKTQKIDVETRFNEMMKNKGAF
jgi:hypothetical protein